MKPGEWITDRFQLEREIGTGGMGTVWRAWDALVEVPVALKVTLGHASLERFEREAAVLAELEHPGIVRYIAHGTTALGAPFLAMEWLEGESLEARLARGALGVGATIVLGARICEALGAAHARGIVHRDLKPGNLLLVGGDAARPKLLDFGIAHAASSPRWRTRTGEAIGTPAYMAPEQARGEREIDVRADVFSLGCVLFECATGRAAFEGEHAMAVLVKILLEDPVRIGALIPDVPELLETLIARMLAKDRSGRPPSAAALGGELAKLTSNCRPPAPSQRDETTPPLESGPPAQGAESLTRREQRMVAIVLRGVSASDREGAAALMPDAETQLDWEPTLELHPALLEVVRNHGARVELVAGGGLALLIMGQGSARDLASRAATCALAMHDGAPLALVMGRAETSSRLPVGATIDRAARLVRRGPGPIWIDPETAGLLDDRFQREHRDGAEILVGRRAADATRTLMGSPTPCVGREPWLAAIEAIYQEAVSQPEARAVVVTAAAGLGKSRLASELLPRLLKHSEKLQIWTAHGDVMGAGGAFNLAAQMIRRTSDIQEGEQLAVRRTKLQERVARHVASTDQKRVATYLGEMIRTQFPHQDDAPLQAARADATLMGDQIRRAWLDFVDAEMKATALVIVLDDLHWGDRPTVSIIDHAMGQLPHRPLFVLALGRPEIATVFPDLWADRSVEQIELPPLTRNAGEKLARSVLGDHPDVSRIVDQAGGNAFFLEELVRATAEGRIDQMPDTVLATVEARITALRPAARHALRAASVFGQTFWVGGVKALAGVEAIATLDDLEAREIITRRGTSGLVGETEFQFRHAVVRDAAYAMLVESDRLLGHKLAADFLDAGGEADAFTIAVHLEKAGEQPRAAEAFQRAARQSLEADDHADAIARAERGVVCGARGETLARLRLVQSDAHTWRAEYSRALQRAEKAKSLLAMGSDSWSDATSNLAFAALVLGDLQRAGSAAEQLLTALRQSRPTPNLLCGAALVSRGCVLRGHHLDLAEALRIAVEPHGADAMPSIRAELSRARSIRALVDGDIVAFIEHETAATASFSQAGNRRRACAARIMVGFGHATLGDYGEAERVLRSALADARRMSVPALATSAKENLVGVLARLGRVEEALPLSQEMITEFRRQGDQRLEASARAALADLRLQKGEYSEAERQARLAIGIAAPPNRPETIAVLAQVLLAQAPGRLSEALSTAKEAWLARESVGYSLGNSDALVALVLARSQFAAHQYDSARATIIAARDRLLARAAKLTGSPWQESFLVNVPEHAETLRLAAEWAAEI